MKTETKWAVITAVLIFIWLFIEKLLGLQTLEKMPTWVLANRAAIILIALFCYFMATREKREHDLFGTMTWNQGFWAAATMTLVFIPICGLLVYVFITAINPDFAPARMAYTTNGSIDKDAIDYFLSLYLADAVIGGLLMSVVFAFVNKRGATDG